MKKRNHISAFLSHILLAVIMFSCTTQKPVEQVKTNSLEGVWQIVSGEWTMQDTIFTFPNGDFKELKSYKFLGETYWAVVGQDTAMDSHYAHAGTYRATENTYVEYFEIHKNIKSIGDSAVFNYTLNGDKWTISSDLLKEEWKRIE